MKIGFLTTINTNIGDDFIRIGIENMIRSVAGSKEVQFTYVNKHHPDEVLLKTSPLHLLKKLPRFRGKKKLENFYYQFLHTRFNVFSKQQLVIQSGAPVLWPNCFTSEWNEPVWYETIGKIHNKIPILNLAAGSCYPWENQEGFLNHKEKVFASRIGGYCRLTTTRDELAHRLFKEAGIKNILLPCSAFLVNSELKNDQTGNYILINYMHAGGHFDWNQQIDASEWEMTMKKVIDRLRLHHEVRFICHNQKEAELAGKLYPGLKIHFPQNIPEYMDCLKHAKAGICNRMHASVAMASFGVPAVSICTDTRLLMLKLLGLPVYYVKEAYADDLIASINHLIANSGNLKKTLFDLKENTINRYQELIRPYCG